MSKDKKKKDEEFAKKLKEEIIKKANVSSEWAKKHLIVIKA
jgi:thioredoxin-related protein